MVHSGLGSTLMLLAVLAVAGIYRAVNWYLAQDRRLRYVRRMVFIVMSAASAYVLNESYHLPTTSVVQAGLRPDLVLSWQWGSVIAALILLIVAGFTLLVASALGRIQEAGDWLD